MVSGSAEPSCGSLGLTPHACVKRGARLPDAIVPFHPPPRLFKAHPAERRGRDGEAGRTACWASCLVRNVVLCFPVCSLAVWGPWFQPRGFQVQPAAMCSWYQDCRERPRAVSRPIPRPASLDSVLWLIRIQRTCEVRKLFGCWNKHRGSRPENAYV